jgi:hypothetical protein
MREVVSAETRCTVPPSSLKAFTGVSGRSIAGFPGFPPGMRFSHSLFKESQTVNGLDVVEIVSACVSNTVDPSDSSQRQERRRHIPSVSEQGL